MKTKVTIWLVTVAQFAMSDRDLYNDVRRHDSEEDALKDFYTTKQWLTDYASRPENEDGSFGGRTFEYELREDVHATTKDPWATVWRNTDVLEELFRGEVRLIRQEFEIDVPIVLDAKDIRQIRIITNDD